MAKRKKLYATVSIEGKVCGVYDRNTHQRVEPPADWPEELTVEFLESKGVEIYRDAESVL